MAKSTPFSCETIQNPQGRDRWQGRGLATINILLELGRVLGR